MNPLISVIIPTYNRKEMLQEAIESVLMQTYENLEIMVVDDCSTDGTEVWFQETYGDHEKIKYTRNTVNRHAGYSRNLGYQQSQGDYLVFLDDDDFYTDRTFFEKAIRLHQSDDYAFVSANADQRYEEDGRISHQPLNRKGRVKKEEFLKGFQMEVNKPHSTFTTLFKREKLQTVDFKNMRMMNDGPIYMRALLTGDPYLMEDFIGIYRIHSTNISFSLDLDFLLKNLDEKVWVCQEAQRRGIPGIGSDWITNQTRVTVNYYVTYSKPDREKQRRLMQWVKENLPKEERTMCLLVQKLVLKAGIRKVLGRKTGL